MHALHDDEDDAGLLIIEARQQSVAIPLIDRLALDVREGVNRLQGIVDDEDIATHAGHGAEHGGPAAKSALGRIDLVIDHAPDAHARENSLIPVRLDDGLELRGMFGRKLGTITDTEDALAWIVPEQESAQGDVEGEGLEVAGRHVDDEPPDLSIRNALRLVCHMIDMPIVHEVGARIDGEKAPHQEQVEPEPQRGVEFADFIRLHHFLPRFHVGFWCAVRHRLGGLLQS